MKRLLALLMVGLLAVPALAQFPTRSNIATTDMAKVTGNWDSWTPWKWAGYESQSVTFTIKNGSSFVDMDAYNVGCKISRRNGTTLTTYIDYTSVATNITITDSNVTMNVAYTNIPSNGKCLVELWAWDGASTSATRTLAQGTLVVFDSIYGEDDSTFPFPGSTNLLSYAPLSALTGYTTTGTLAGVTFTVSNSLLYINTPASLTGIVFNVSGTNILLKQNN